MATDSSQLHLLERAIAAASNAIVISDAADPKNPIIYCNPAFEKLTGYTSQEVIGSNCRFLQGPDTDLEALEQIRNALRQEREIKIILKNYRKDKTPFWNELTISPVRDANGKLTHFIGVQNDISDAYDELRLRQQAEKEVCESREMYEQILDAIPDMVLCKGPHSRLLYANKAFRDLYGMSNEQLRDIIDSPFNNPDYTQQYVIDDTYVFNSGKSLNIPEEPVTKYDGEVRIFHTVKTPIKDSEGKVLKTVGFSRDITERKQAEDQLKIANEQLETRVQERTAALEASQQMLRLVIDNIPQAVFWKDRNLVYMGCNQKLARIAGLSDPAEIVGKSDWDLPWKPEESEFYRATDFQIIETNTPQYHVIESQQRADGEQRWSDTNKVPLLDANGKVVGILGSFEDITERMVLENKVRESEELFRKIFEEAPIGIDLVSLENKRFVGVNKAFCEMLGYTETELLVKTFVDITQPEDVDKNKLLAESAERGEIPRYQMEKRLIAATGEIVWVNVTATIIRDAEGKGIYNLGMIENISDRKLSEAALRQSEAQLRKQATQLQQAYEQLQQTQAKLVHTEKMSSLGQMIAGIAHEINNPVTFIEGNIIHASDYFKQFTEVLQLYQQCYPSPAPEIAEKIEEIELNFLIDDLPKMLYSIKMGAQRIGQIVLSLRNFSRLDEADKKFVDIHEGIDNTLLIVQHRLTRNGQKGGIKIVKDYGQLPQVECCAGQLNQVFMNIISNAIDVLIDQPEPRTITIGTSLGTRKSKLNQDGENHHLASPSSGIGECEFMTICIADNGPGMTEETRLRLFDPFFTTKPVGSGTGLGLSISYQIVVEKHGGTLRCVSAPGAGAEFWIEIPLCDRANPVVRESKSAKGF